MYNGYVELKLTQEEYSELYCTEQLKGYILHENEYLIVDLEENGYDYFQMRSGRLQHLKYPIINSSFSGKLKPRNPQQYCAFHMLMDNVTLVKVLKGVYGSGKDLIMLNAALSLVEQGKYKQIIYIRPNVIVKDLPDIGALPGTAEEKLGWTLGPLVSKLGGEEGLQMLLNRRIIQPIPLIYIRGCDFQNSIIYVSEGQNMTVEIVKLLLGRVGEGSTIWLNGDTHQTDKHTFDKDNGLNALIECLKGNRLFGYVYMPITERSEVANLANLLDEYEMKQGGK